MPEQSAVSVKNLSKQFDNVEVLRDINLTVEKGTVVSILGSSGSGKSTLLRCMNWLEQPDRGEVRISGQRLGIDDASGKAMSHKELSKIRERVGMVFQSFNLWPHLTVLQNVTEALIHVKGMKRDAADEIGRRQLDKVGMSHKTDVYPITLSGGQKQRVAVTHEMDFARQVSDEVVFLEKGLLIEKASPEKFFTNPNSDRVRKFLQSSR